MDIGLLSAPRLAGIWYLPTPTDDNAAACDVIRPFSYYRLTIYERNLLSYLLCYSIMGVVMHCRRCIHWLAASRIFVVILILLGCYTAIREASADESAYRLQPGDHLTISVWKEPDVTREDVPIHPDGTLSLPLVGQVGAGGKTVKELQSLLTQRLSKFIPEPALTVGILETSGNKIYVIGKVNKPSEYIVSRPIDVMQALSMAGGMTEYASENKIRILRRNSSGEQIAIKFRYKDVADGDDLAQNIVLRAGDTVVVP